MSGVQGDHNAHKACNFTTVIRERRSVIMSFERHDYRSKIAYRHANKMYLATVSKIDRSADTCPRRRAREHESVTSPSAEAAPVLRDGQLKLKFKVTHMS